MVARIIGCLPHAAYVSIRSSLIAASAFAVALAGVAGIAAPAHALTIVPTFDSSITSNSNAASYEGDINNAINAIDSYIANPVQVNIDFKNTSTGLGQSSTFFNSLAYSTYVSNLNSNAAPSPYQATANATLPTTNPVPGNNSSSVDITLPLLRALGHSNLGNNGGNFDSTISLNLSDMNLNRTSPQNSSKYDLQAVAAHEIDEVLSIGGSGSNLSTNTTTNQTGNVRPLDLFRFSGNGVRSYNPSTNISSYFSINKGQSSLVHFNQNGSTDSSDFGDWGNGAVPAEAQPNNPPQVQDAYGDPGIPGPNLGSNELIALNVVGWNLTAAGLAVASSAVPEPATWGLLAIGAIGLLARRRKFSA